MTAASSPLTVPIRTLGVERLYDPGERTTALCGWNYTVHNESSEWFYKETALFDGVYGERWGSETENRTVENSVVPPTLAITRERLNLVWFQGTTVIR